jgi:hypothetical protein
LHRAFSLHPSLFIIYIISATDHGEELPQHLLEAIPKLVQAVASHEAVISVLGLKLEVVQQELREGPSHVAKLIESIREKEYRCVTSNRPMFSPVMALDGNYYEQSPFEAHPLSCHVKMSKPLTEGNNLRVLQGEQSQYSRASSVLWLFSSGATSRESPL